LRIKRFKNAIILKARLSSIRRASARLLLDSNTARFFYFALSQAFLLAIRLSASTSSFSTVTALAAPKFHALNPRNGIQMPAKNRQETRIVKTRPSGMGYRVPIRPKTSANTKCSTYENHKSLLRDSKGIQPLWWGPGQSPTKKKSYF
jgi:hypothetical protein